MGFFSNRYESASFLLSLKAIRLRLPITYLIAESVPNMRMMCDMIMNIAASP